MLQRQRVQDIMLDPMQIKSYRCIDKDSFSAWHICHFFQNNCGSILFHRVLIPEGIRAGKTFLCRYTYSGKHCVIMVIKGLVAQIAAVYVPRPVLDQTGYRETKAAWNSLKAVKRKPHLSSETYSI